jgi:hypothetical protein
MNDSITAGPAIEAPLLLTDIHRIYSTYCCERGTFAGAMLREALTRLESTGQCW